ncbi:LLM class flavin-dependent oxidoreductase [Cohnella abietis]|uniref:Putative monooxygenase YxeK n=1 Tax=Cohnella abietis TaxID=2507935 RepID=A0A3T1CZ68_9BACL|nr:LLM class flavin-dependent oxidoreductase [Cohnella abietis]BBI31136.1 putative monooxygenase YxeK [Cohnella abietis]
MGRRQNEQLKFGVLLNSTGMHLGAWKREAAKPEQALEQSYLRHLAEWAERGKFDFIFLADSLFYMVDRPAITSAAVRLEPYVMLSALSVWTNRIGLAATVSTSFNEPFHLAESFAELDTLSQGRAAWNIVTSVSDMEAQNYSRDKINEHSKRYEVADEFVELVGKLWDSVDPIEHKGEHFSVSGALPYAAIPQGRPVYIQAGSSPVGQIFAAKHAEVVFTQLSTLSEAKQFYANVKSGVERAGRNPDDLKILPALAPILGATVEEAKQKEDELHSLVDPQIGLRMLSSLFNHDLSVYPLDGPLPAIAETNGIKSTVKVMESLGINDGWTIRQISQRFAGTRGNQLFVGTPQQLADHMQEWFEERGCDGFNLTFPILPDGLEYFVEHVVPILQERGIFREDYSGTTLREHLAQSKVEAQKATGGNQND